MLVVWKFNGFLVPLSQWMVQDYCGVVVGLLWVYSGFSIGKMQA